MKMKRKKLFLISFLLFFFIACCLIFKQYFIPYYEQNDFTRFQQIVEHGSSTELAEFFASTSKRDWENLIFIYDSMWEPFYFIAKQNNMEKLKILSKNGLRCLSFSAQTNYPVTCLALVRRPQMLEFLLKSEGNIKVGIINPLSEAIKELLSGKQGHMKYNDMQSKINPRWHEYLQMKQTDDEKILESIKLLIEYKVGINNQKSGWRETPLMVACSQGRLDIIELLLSAGADPSIEYKTQTAVDFCKKSNNFINESEKEKAIDLLNKAITKKKSQKQESAAASEQL